MGWGEGVNYPVRICKGREGERNVRSVPTPDPLLPSDTYNCTKLKIVVYLLKSTVVT